MSDLDIKDMKVDDMFKKNFNNFSITLKRDGTLMYWIDGNLTSARGINRNDRFPHIQKILKDNSFPNCLGEMYIEGGKVFDISSRENWNRAEFMPFDLLDKSLKFSERQALLQKKVSELNSESITQMIRFTDVIEGWNYVLENKEEGLVIRNEREWIKVKVLQEVKMKITGHEPSKEKGTFILENGNRISGTSKEFVVAYYNTISQGKEAIAEIEYCFITKDGHFFQPRLRQITERAK